MLIAYFKILKKRNFFCLWFGQIISQFGDRLTQMALIGLVYRIEPGSPIELAKMMSLAILPVFLISPVAGVYVDRWNKQKTMFISDIARAILIMLIPLYLRNFTSLIPIYILVFLSFCAGRFFIPAKMAIIPSLIKNKSLFLANSLISVTAMIAAVLGFGIGGIIVEKWGVKAALLIDAVTFFISAIFILCIKIKEHKPRFDPHDIINLGKDAILNVKNSFMHETKEGIRYLLNSSQTRYAGKIMFVLFASIGSLYVTFIVFIQNTLATITMDVGWLAVAIGVGLFLGSIVYGRIGNKIPVKTTINISLFIASVYLTGFVYFLKINPNKTFAFYSSLFLGLLTSPIAIAVNTLIHQESKNNFWGRIFSYLEVVIHLAFMLFMFTAAYLAEALSPFTIILTTGIIITAFSLVNMVREK